MCAPDRRLSFINGRDHTMSTHLTPGRRHPLLEQGARLAVGALAAFMTLTAVGCESGNATTDTLGPSDNALSEEEREAGWQLLFDGTSLDGWRGLGRDDIPEGHWTVESGTIRKVASGDVPTAPDGQPLEGGDIVTEETFEDFELTFQWRVREIGNSGIKYNVSEPMSVSHPPVHAALGFEYQILDDDRHPDALNGPTRMAGALYDMIPPGERKRLEPVGAWNEARIVFDGGHGEHWLNGELVVEFDLGTSRFDSLLSASKYAGIEGFAEARTGHIVLQDHGDDVWFQNLKIRRL